jgi:streptogramin lyase
MRFPDPFDLEVHMRDVFRCLAVGVALVAASVPPPAAGLMPTAVDPEREVSADATAHGGLHFKERLHVAIAVGNGPTGAGFGEHFAWVTNGVDVSVSKINPRNNRVTKTIPLNTAGFPVRAATTPGALWISECGIDSVVRINARTGRTEAIIPTGVCPFGIDVSKGDVFVAHADDKVVRIDPSSNTVVATIPVRIEPTPDDFNLIGLRVAFGSVWVTTAVSTVVRIDPVHNRVAETITLGPCCGHVGEIVASRRALWISGDQFNNSMYRIDPRLNRIVAVIPSPAGGLLHGNGYLDGFVWVISQDDDGVSQLMRVDPHTNTMQATSILLGLRSFAMTTGDGSLWVPSFDENSVHRVTLGTDDLEHDHSHD